MTQQCYNANCRTYANYSIYKNKIFLLASEFFAFIYGSYTQTNPNLTEKSDSEIAPAVCYGRNSFSRDSLKTKTSLPLCALIDSDYVKFLPQNNKFLTLHILNSFAYKIYFPSETWNHINHNHSNFQLHFTLFPQGFYHILWNIWLIIHIGFHIMLVVILLIRFSIVSFKVSYYLVFYFTNFHIQSINCWYRNCDILVCV